jgi:hypothetical protein
MNLAIELIYWTYSNESLYTHTLKQGIWKLWNLVYVRGQHVLIIFDIAVVDSDEFW